MRFVNDDSAKLFLRLSVGVLMLLHGVFGKIIPGIDWMVAQLGIFAYGVYAGEVLAPILLILGVFTRISAILIAFTMLVAGFVATGGQIFALNQYGGWVIELQWLYFAASLVIAALGDGRYSLCKKCQDGCKI